MNNDYLILRKCPFCGGKAKLMGGNVNTIPEYGENGAFVGADIEVELSWVECQNCHSMGLAFNESYEDSEKAIEAWNRRADDGTVNMPDVGMMIEDSSAPSVVDVVRCNNCKWFSNDTECKNCADIDEPCGYCRYFGACVRDDGYCYHGEMTEITSEMRLL